MDIHIQSYIGAIHLRFCFNLVIYVAEMRLLLPHLR